jgi:hypothetical protein
MTFVNCLGGSMRNLLIVSILLVSQTIFAKVKDSDFYGQYIYNLQRSLREKRADALYSHKYFELEGMKIEIKKDHALMTNIPGFKNGKKYSWERKQGRLFVRKVAGAKNRLLGSEGAEPGMGFLRISGGQLKASLRVDAVNTKKKNKTRSLDFIFSKLDANGEIIKKHQVKNKTIAKYGKLYVLKKSAKGTAFNKKFIMFHKDGTLDISDREIKAKTSSALPFVIAGKKKLVVNRGEYNIKFGGKGFSLYPRVDAGKAHTFFPKK